LDEWEPPLSQDGAAGGDDQIVHLPRGWCPVEQVSPDGTVRDVDHGEDQPLALKARPPGEEGVEGVGPSGVQRVEFVAQFGGPCGGDIPPPVQEQQRGFARVLAAPPRGVQGRGLGVVRVEGRDEAVLEAADGARPQGGEEQVPRPEPVVDRPGRGAEPRGDGRDRRGAGPVLHRDVQGRVEDPVLAELRRSSHRRAPPDSS
jgi:hypothetical protein